MNQRLIGGFFTLAISLAVVGAAVTAGDDRADGAAGSGLASQVVDTSDRTVEAATAQVPLRSGDLDSQARLWRADERVAPVAVRIGALGLEAPVRSVGVDANNDFDVPEAETVGWYKHGPAPGQTGSTVLAAHVDYGGRPGAFFSLAELTVGDVFEVELSDGSVLQYRVTETVLYDKTTLPAEELFRKDGDEVLRLITCGGSFDSIERSYQGNVVVTAEPIDA